MKLTIKSMKGSSLQMKSLRLSMPPIFIKGKKGIHGLSTKDDITVDTLTLSGRSLESVVSGRSENETKSESVIAARMDAVKQLQGIEGNSHPDVLFAMKYLARAHRRNGDLLVSKQMEEIIRAHHIIQSHTTLVSL